MVYAALVLVQVLFSSLAVVGRHVLREVPPGGVIAFRVLGASLVLLAIQAARRGPWVTDRRDLWRLAGVGTLGITLNQSLFVFGLKFTTAINATILVTLVPVFTVLGSVLLRREPPSALKLAGIACAGAGAVWLIGPDRLTLAPETALGNLLIVLGMACFAAYFIFSKDLLRTYDPLTVITYCMTIALLGVLPIGWWAMRSVDLAAIRPATWGWVGYLVLGPTVGTYLLNVWALRRVSPNAVAVFIYLQPLVTGVVAPLVLPGEHLTGRVVGAGLAIFAGVGLVVLAEHRQRRDVPLESPVAE